MKYLNGAAVMCGIFAILSIDGRLDSNKIDLNSWSEILKHRGPDDEGRFEDDHVFLGHRRLSIIDLETGKQPIFNEDKTKCVVFNGEIYNFQEIRSRLEGLGHIFETNTDTEVIIHAYEQWGEGCVDHFRGMFAFVLWDISKKQLFAARDRLGIKPLYYAVHEKHLIIASEMKAIITQPGFSMDLDDHALAAYFTIAYIPAPFSVYKSIRKLPAGHLITVSGGDLRIRKYWDVQFNPDHSLTDGAIVNRFNELMDEAVRLRMISDVPLGAFLSGGIDSGTVVALMSRNSISPVHTFCIGFGGDVGGYLDERNFAREVSGKYQTHHREFEVQPDIEGIVDKIVTAFDEPFADHSTIPSYYLYKMTKQNVTVALSGLGGDELFGGYERYLGIKLSQSYNSLVPSFIHNRLLMPIINNLPERRDGHYTINHLKRFIRNCNLPLDKRYFGFISMMPHRGSNPLFNADFQYDAHLEQTRDLFLGYINSSNASDPLDKIFYCDMKTYLPEDILACTDAMSMRHALRGAGTLPRP